MKNNILDFPKQFSVGINAAKNLKIAQKFGGVCVCGMGGSALPGNVLELFLKQKNINVPLILCRDYDLPAQVKKDWLIVCVSYSGNTEETISCLIQAKKKNLKIAAIASGGKLKTLSNKHNIPCALIPKGLQPRMALGYQFSALIQLLENAGIIKHGSKEILSLEKKLESKKWEKQGKKLAKKLINKTPVIYASSNLKTLARIWKIKFNENSKTPAFWNYFPELNHNEMAGFENNFQFSIFNFQFYFIIIEDKNDHPRIKKRMNLTAQLLKQQGLKGETIKLKGKSLMEKFFSNVLFSEWTSYYLALEYKIDPEPVKLVEKLKKQMK